MSCIVRPSSLNSATAHLFCASIFSGWASMFSGCFCGLGGSLDCFGGLLCNTVNGKDDFNGAQGIVVKLFGPHRPEIFGLELRFGQNIASRVLGLPVDGSRERPPASVAVGESAVFVDDRALSSLTIGNALGATEPFF